MTTKKQIKDLLEPIMASNPDIVISGQLFFIAPIRHVMCGFDFQRGLTRDYCHVAPFSTETCARRNLPLYNPFDRVRFNGRDGLYWDRPEQINELQQRLETEILPKLRSVYTLPAYVEYRYGAIWDLKQNFIGLLLALPTIIANGDLDLAAQIHNEVFAPLDWAKVEANRVFRQSIDWYRGFKVLFEPLLNRDIPKLVTILRDFERESITKSGYETYWEKAPFPLEEQL